MILIEVFFLGCNLRICFEVGFTLNLFTCTLRPFSFPEFPFMKLNFLLARKKITQEVDSAATKLERTLQLPQDVSVYTKIFGTPFRFQHGASFAATY